MMKRMKWKKRWIIVMFCFIISGCFILRIKEIRRTEEIEIIKREEQIEKEQHIGQENESEKQLEGIIVEQTILEQFGAYLKILIQESRMDELEPYVISRLVSWEEGGEMADWCPAFHHFSEYGEYYFGGMSERGVILTEADLNGDGIADMIEYLQGEYDSFNKAGLIIYLGNREKNYQITYYQPNFDTEIHYADSIFAVNYKNSIFLVLKKENEFPYLLNESGKVTVYRIQDGKLTEKLMMQYQLSSIEAEIMDCKKGMEEKAEVFLEKAEQYYMESANDGLFQGEAEKHVEENNPEMIYLLKRAGKEQSEAYKKKYKKERELQFTSAAVYLSAMYHSDLDNDGEEEIYAKKQEKLLGMFITISSGRRYFYRTGEFIREGMEGLNYTLVDGGNWTDFEILCGLDIWSGSDIPQIFWVEPWNGENITFIKYYDKNYQMGLIEGYRIKEGNYETVLSVQYRPILVFQMNYEKKSKEEEQVADYLVCMEKKEGIGIRVPVPVIHGLSDPKLEEEINRNLEKILLENMEEYHTGIIYGEIKGAVYNSIAATKDYLLFDYEIGGADMFVEINLKSGEIQLYKKFDVEEGLHKAGW